MLYCINIPHSCMVVVWAEDSRYVHGYATVQAKTKVSTRICTDINGEGRSFTLSCKSIFPLPSQHIYITGTCQRNMSQTDGIHHVYPRFYSCRIWDKHGKFQLSVCHVHARYTFDLESIGLLCGQQRSGCHQFIRGQISCSEYSDNRMISVLAMTVFSQISTHCHRCIRISMGYIRNHSILKMCLGQISGFTAMIEPRFTLVQYHMVEISTLPYSHSDTPSAYLCQIHDKQGAALVT